MIFNRLLQRIRGSATPAHDGIDRVFDLTWSIPQEYGGLTKVMLRRSRNFVTRLGLSVDVLTLDYRLDVDEARDRLRGSGELIDGMRLRNAWDEVATYDRRQLKAFAGTRTGGGIPEARESAETHSTSRYVEHLDSAGKVERVDHLRADGSTWLIDDRTGEKRRLVLIDPDGRYVGEFTRARDFYFAWLDAAIGAEQAVLINESKYIATFLFHYRRDHIRIGQVLHNSHLHPTSDSPNGPFTKSRLDILRHWFDYDFIVFLTQKQKADFVRAFGDSPTLVVIPNSTAVSDDGLGEASRSSDRGAVVARLTGQKRVDHALTAVSEVGPEMTLDIIGDGDKRAELERTVHDSDVLSRRVTFTGHVDGAAARLSDYSFLLLTSSFEGMGVVLIEAMARGCVPIAYDIRYGPSDIIDSGENGYLVDDPRQMAAAITALLDTDASALAALRQAAIAKARTFSDESVTERWAQLFADLQETPRPPSKRAPDPQPGEAALDSRGDVIIRLSDDSAQHGADDAIVMSTRDGYYSFASAITADGTATFTADQLARVPSGAIVDVWRQTPGPDRIARHRIAWTGEGGATETVAADGVEAHADDAGGRAVVPYRTVKGNLSLKVG